VPRECPYWQLQAIRALIKPQFKHAIAHRRSVQPWSAADRNRAKKLWERLRLESRRRTWLDLHFPDGGDYLLIATYPPNRATLAKSLAIELSNALPRHWLVVGDLLTHRGVLYRRTGLRKLELRPTTTRRPPRAVKSAVIDIYRSLNSELS
jgi:hypothetical protein